MFFIAVLKFKRYTVFCCQLLSGYIFSGLPGLGNIDLFLGFFCPKKSILFIRISSSFLRLFFRLPLATIEIFKSQNFSLHNMLEPSALKYQRAFSSCSTPPPNFSGCQKGNGICFLKRKSRFFAPTQPSVLSSKCKKLQPLQLSDKVSCCCCWKSILLFFPTADPLH